MLVCERFENVREVRRLRLGRDTKSIRAVARQTCLRVHPRLCYPDGMVFLDGRLNRTLEPSAVRLHI